MNKRSILFCINYMHTGGVEKSLLSLIDALPRDRFEIHLALMQHKGELLNSIPDDVQLHILTDIERHMPRLAYPLRHAGGICGPMSYLAAKLRGSLIPYYHRILGDNPALGGRHFDIAVSYQGPNELLDWYVPTHISADRYAAWIHFDISHSYINPRTQRTVYPLYDRIFIISESAREVFCKVFPDFADRAEVLHNVVDTCRVRMLADEYNVETAADITTICTVGRVSREKAPDFAVETAIALKRRGFRFRWLWVGEGDMLQCCRKAVAKAGLDDSLQFVGLKANPYPYMKAADVYVQPSRHEGYCITLAEARAFGMPTVCTAFAGSEQTAGLPNAQILAAPSADEMADAIIRAAKMPHTACPDEVSPRDIQKLIDL